MNPQTSVWKPLVDAWLEREGRVHPEHRIDGSTLVVRDAIEVGDSAYVLASFEVDSPWPAEEDATGTDRTDTVVVEAVRTRQPWTERDSTRALAHARSDDGRVQLYSHLLGATRAVSGRVNDAVPTIELSLTGGRTVTAQVVDGWFLAVIDARDRIDAISGLDGDSRQWTAGIERDDLPELLDGFDFTRHAGRSMYFSPLDLRRVIPLIQWERSGPVVVVASCLELYDDGGIVRLRIDGIRPDDDVLQSWPSVHVETGGHEVASAITAEDLNADTVTLDVGFSPALADGTTELNVTVVGLRSAEGTCAPVRLTLRLDSNR